MGVEANVLDCGRFFFFGEGGCALMTILMSWGP